MEVNQFTLEWPLRPRSWYQNGGQPDAEGYVVLSSRHPRFRAPYGWRRIPLVLLEKFHGRTTPWLVATRNIRHGTELTLGYMNPNIVDGPSNHCTKPMPCK